MHASLRKLSTYCLLGSVSALSLVTGCEGLESDSDQADRKAEQAVQAGLTKLQSGAPAEASASIQPVANEQALSAMGKARAMGVLAETELASAKKILDELATSRVNASAYAWQMDQLISKLGEVTQLGASYRSFDPADPKAQIQEAVKKAQGAPNAPIWFEDPTGNGDLPSLSQINQTISQLEGQISDRRQKIAELTKQRDELNKQAQDELDKVGQLSGQAAVDQFRRGTDLRQRAATISSQIQQLNHQLMPLTADLEVAQSHKKIVEEAIARYQEQNKQLEETWKTITAQADEQQRIARELLNDRKDMASITTYADQLATIIDEAGTAREKANQHLQEAIRYASQAASSADSAVTGYSQRATANPNSKPAFDVLRGTYNSSHFKLIQLRAQHLLATSLADQAALLGLQANAATKLDPLVKQGQMTLPASLARTDLANELQAARQAADEAFTAAAELAEDIVGAPASTDQQQATAQVYRALTEHAWTVAKRTAGDNQAAEQHLAAAKAAVQAAMDLKAVMPPLPAELNVAAATPARTGTPATPEVEAQ